MLLITAFAPPALRARETPIADSTAALERSATVKNVYLLGLIALYMQTTSD
jgi:hypothetical protein